MDPPGYTKPSLQDLRLTDIDSRGLRVIAAAMESDYSGSVSFPGSYPVNGMIWAPNYRLMENLVCRRQTKSNSSTRNIIFLVDTGSPCTYLCQRAMESLIEKDSRLPQSLSVKFTGKE